MARLKGIRIRRLSDEQYEVTPLFYGKRGSTVTVSKARQIGKVLADVVAAVVAAARQLKGP